MTTEANLNRVKLIYRMLLEIVNGNLAYRIEFDQTDLQFNELAKALNDFADKMQVAEYTNPFLNNVQIKSSNFDEPAVLIQKVQDYILNHLENKLPSTNELSKLFGTNEFTLKESFRDILKTSIYQFYNDHRLNKAHLLIEQTSISLEKIAVLSGFKSYTTFYKAFKKKYSYKPSELQRNESKESEK